MGAHARQLAAATPARQGLATLELVLSLPILLFVMALIINFGTVASWKVRGLTNARNAVWSSRVSRNGGAMPRPTGWPLNAGMGTAGAGHLAELDDPRANRPVARGPLPYGCRVKDDLLNPSRGLREGSADLRRFPTLLPSLGPYDLHARHHLLDDKWQYDQMGLSSNRSRRTIVLYELPKADPSLANAYMAAAMAIVSAPFRDALRPLDNDDEFIYWRGGAPDFHPRLHQFCSLKQDEARDRVQDLIDRIQGHKGDPEVPSLAQRMAEAFRGLYQYAIRQLQQSPGNNQAQIAQLQQKIAILDQFLGSL
jgi:hypothetical protein